MQSINEMLFSNEVKKTNIRPNKADLGQVDLIIYSLASSSYASYYRCFTSFCIETDRWYFYQ
jgi:trans-2-enoyl-CoA reductase